MVTRVASDARDAHLVERGIAYKPEPHLPDRYIIIICPQGPHESEIFFFNLAHGFGDRNPLGRDIYHPQT